MREARNTCKQQKLMHCKISKKNVTLDKITTMCSITLESCSNDTPNPTQDFCPKMINDTMALTTNLQLAKQAHSNHSPTLKIHAMTTTSTCVKFAHPPLNDGHFWIDFLYFDSYAILPPLPQKINY